MSRLYETLRRMEIQGGKSDPIQIATQRPVEAVNRVAVEPSEMEMGPSAKVNVTPKSCLAALSDPRGLAAEKFRALVTRLEHQRKERHVQSIQIASAVSHEGKTVIAGNLAVTLAKHTGSRVLVVEGDLHLPGLASLFGLRQLPGIGDWWSARMEKETISQFVHRLDELPLWILCAGVVSDQPSQILQSARFAEMFVRLVSWFDWVVVDSTPILPLVDANLWSRIVDGTLMVVREGVTPIRALRKCFDNLDDPRLIGVVLNEASEFDRTSYSDQYYGHYHRK